MKITIHNVDIFVINCTNFWKRFKGMMFLKKKLSYGFCFPKCNSIHTFFMRQNIDVIMTSRDGTILYYYHNLKPWRIILPKKNVYCTYEFSCNILPMINIDEKIKET